MDTETALDWLGKNPDILAISPATCDLNGNTRGKRLPRSSASKAVSGTMRMPRSALNVDILGDDIDGSPLVFATGDQDGILRPTDRGLVPAPWLSSPAALLPMSMHNEDGTPFEGDARHALVAILDRFAERGWQVTAATELEFYLLDKRKRRPPKSPLTGKRPQSGEILSLRTMDAFETFFDELYRGCADMGIAADAATSESGLAQFEVNLTHGPALRTADDTWLFKQLVKGLARRHGMAATFMAKPYAEWPGNGLHLHMSITDTDGRNVFDNGGPRGTDAMMFAIGGCLSAMAESTPIFAPHANSYDRLVPESHAPTGIGWGYENRTTAIRVPGGPTTARRLEHRVAGGDTNPYLVMSAILGAALTGIEDTRLPPKPVTGNAYTQALDQIPDTWENALNSFENSRLMRRIFPELLISNLIATKRQEMAIAENRDLTQVYIDTL